MSAGFVTPSERNNLILLRAIEVVLSIAFLIVVTPLWLAIVLALSIEARKPGLHLTSVETAGGIALRFLARPQSELDALLWRTRLRELPLLLSVLRGDLTLTQAFAEYAA
jgi:lipopolysaccharide/colanic/teichoic acid biosynthesis glycosyltransferase